VVGDTGAGLELDGPIAVMTAGGGGGGGGSSGGSKGCKGCKGWLKLLADISADGADKTRTGPPNDEPVDVGLTLVWSCCDGDAAVLLDL
jgi:hypothetical protein